MLSPEQLQERLIYILETFLENGDGCKVGECLPVKWGIPGALGFTRSGYRVALCADGWCTWERVQ